MNIDSVCGTLRDLSSQCEYELETGDISIPTAPPSVRKQNEFIIHPAVSSNGRCVALLKSALTTACERNCNYCAFRSGRDFRRQSLKPDEMAAAFMALFRAGIAEGLFLSSGIAGGGCRTQDQILATAEILRSKYQYQGYLHLKLMPGAEYAQVESAMHLADRVSINLEAPNPDRLELLAPKKNFFGELLQPLHWVQQIRNSYPPIKGWKGRWPSTTTQFVVGAVGETDSELLSTTEMLIREVGIKRAYFSIFTPVVNTPFENLPGVEVSRQHHLYQASFLLRDYGFALADLPFEETGDLPKEVDPKLAWANKYLVDDPVEINTADRNHLLRVPGIGPKSADIILEKRKLGHLRDMATLHALGIDCKRASPYLLLDGHRPPRQLSLF